MLKYRLYILAAFYIILTLAVFSIFNSRGCYLHPNGEPGMPVLTPNSFYYIDKQFNSLSEMKHGDIILYTPRDSKEKPKPGRITAIQGETVEITGGDLFINGEKSEQALSIPDRIDKTYTLLKTTIPKNFLFILPDSRNKLDPEGRIYFVHVHQVKGKILKSLFRNESL